MYNSTESNLFQALQPQFVLDVELAELCITAGLQDRVIQVREEDIIPVISLI